MAMIQPGQAGEGKEQQGHNNRVLLQAERQDRWQRTGRAAREEIEEETGKRRQRKRKERKEQRTGGKRGRCYY